MVIPTRLWKILPSAAVGVAAFTLNTETACAFFPPIPNTPDTVTVSPPPPPVVVVPVSPPPVSPPVSPPPVVVPPVSPPPVVVPPVPPPPFVPPPPPPSVPPVVTPQGGDPGCTCTCPHPTPQTVPEPATIVSGFLGLSVLGGYAWRRKKGAGEQSK